jgi:hypothetical protein
MAGDERVRFCQGCRKQVYNISAMNRSDAERLVCDSAGELCVRFGRMPDGRVHTLDYRTLGSRPRGWRFWTVLSACAASIVAGVNAYIFSRGNPVPPPPAMALGSPPIPVMMGGACAPPARPVGKAAPIAPPPSPTDCTSQP